MKRRITVLAVMAIVALSFTIANAEGIDKPWLDEVGMFVSFADESSRLNPDDKHDLYAKRLTLFGTKYAGDGRRWKFEGEVHGSFHSASGADGYTQANEFGVNLVFKREFPSKLAIVPYIGFMAGTSRLLDTNNQPQFGDSGWLGTFGPLVGVNILLDDDWYVRTEYRLTHSSDPFNSDVGRNLNNVNIGLVYVF
jgi:opacity protein-like surface antigen